MTKAELIKWLEESHIPNDDQVDIIISMSDTPETIQYQPLLGSKGTYIYTTLNNK